MKKYVCRTREGITTLTDEDIYKMMLPFVWRLLRQSYWQFEEHHADIAQIAIGKCLSSMDRYDQDRGTVYTYCAFVIKRTIRHWAKEYVEGPGTHETPLDECNERPIIDRSGDLESWLDELRKTLNRRERKVLKMLLDGKSRTDVYVSMHPERAGIRRCGTGFEALPEWKGIVAKARKLGPPTID